MERKIFTYALLKSFYDTGKDYIDCFCPFVLNAMSNLGHSDLQTIQDRVGQTTGLNIPQYTLKTILKRAKRHGYAKVLGDGNYDITKKGVQISAELRDQESLEQQLGELSANLAGFLRTQGNRTIDDTLAFSILSAFIQANLILIIEYLNPEIPCLYEGGSRLEPSIKKDLLDYVEQIRLDQPKLYETFLKIVVGCALSSALFCPDIGGIKDGFRGMTVFLDSNFVLSMLGFDHDQFTVPAQELFSMLKEGGFKLKVFDITVTEICRLINAFPSRAAIYTNNVRVNSIYSKLKLMGWSKSQVRRFVLAIEEDLSDRGVEIVPLEGIDIDMYEPEQHQLRDLLAQYKPEQPRSSQNHDLIAIAEVKKRRKYVVRDIQRAGTLFLTSDLKLARFNFEQYGHKTGHTVSEVVSDFFLANFLWLQNPSRSFEMPIKLLIAAHSQYFFVQRKVWDQFVFVLRQLKNDRVVSNEKIAALLYYGRLEDLLRGIDESQREKITPDFVMEKIEQAGKEIDKIIEKKLAEKESEVSQILESRFSTERSQQDKEWLSRISKIKSKLKATAQSKGVRMARVLSSLATLGILAVVTFLFWFGLRFRVQNERLSLVSACISIITFFLGGGGLIGVWRDLFRYLKRVLSEHYYGKLLRSADLADEHNGS